MAGEKSDIILKELSIRAVSEFDDLKKKCKEHYDKYVHEHDKVQRLESQFKQLKRVSLLAVAEYENLSKRFNDETKAKLHLENKLKKVEEENKELRKANKFGSNTAILPTNDKDAAGAFGTKGELEGLRALLSGMKDELRRTKSDLTKVQEKFVEEKKEHEATRQKVKIGTAHIQQLNRVSVLALDEFQDLRKKYENELECRKQAEEYASEMLRERELQDRKSKLLDQQVNSDERLQKAVQELESLSKALEEEKQKSQTKIKELEEELTSAKDAGTVKSIEDKMSVALDQVELLQKQLANAEERSLESERKISELQQKLLRAEAIASGQAPPPPPPAPPPPPPIPAPALRKFITKIGGKKKKGKGGDEAEEKDDPKAQMMMELMKRIELRSQGLLNQTNPAPKNDKGDGTAMNELAGLLGNLRRGRAGSKENALEKEQEKAEEKQEPAFIKVKLRKTSAKSNASTISSDSSSSDNELMKKLGKRKESVEQQAKRCGSQNQSNKQQEKLDVSPTTERKKSATIHEESELPGNSDKTVLVNGVTTDAKASTAGEASEKSSKEKQPKDQDQVPNGSVVDGQIRIETTIEKASSAITISGTQINGKTERQLSSEKEHEDGYLKTEESGNKESVAKGHENESSVVVNPENKSPVIKEPENELAMNSDVVYATPKTPPVLNTGTTSTVSVETQFLPLDDRNKAELKRNESFNEVEDSLENLMKSLEEFTT